ncbi:MAG: hypothetical protein FWG67_07095 [Defluviitaleaceae bacterium]|nr:hypothetical protein [Defluviitaleaceae bacterium]
MRDLISFSYNLDATTLQAFGEIYYIDHGKTFTYIIPVGSQKNTTFFHLLKFINASPYFSHIFTVENAPTLLIRDVHFFCLYTTLKLHQTITESQLGVPILYPAEYPLAEHFKIKWLQKNQIHEDNLNLALDKTPPTMRAILFDIATYYIHLSEEAYRLLKPVESTVFSTSLCHARIKPDTPLYQCFMPDYLILDNRSRIYCEYLRYLFLETNNMVLVERVVAHVSQTDPLTPSEWHFLYARLYFPTHFYDTVYDLIVNGQVNLDALYEQTMNYTELLASLPLLVQQYTGVLLDTPEWTRLDQKM